MKYTFVSSHTYTWLRVLPTSYDIIKENHQKPLKLIADVCQGN